MDKKFVVNSVYEHIGNGGVTFGVTDEHGPTIVIEASHMGHITNHIELLVTKESLANLGKMFTEAAQLTYGPNYSCATESSVYDKDTDKLISHNRRVRCGTVGAGGHGDDSSQESEACSPSASPKYEDGYK